MTGNINLTASMRTNLLSLQQISKLQDRTQLRLSTGLKVNSAIDNPSSYYTAQSLNNRADDLSALLDSMGQGIQTIKAASEGIETAEDLVTQMKAIAEQVSTSGTYVPDKEYFIKEVGANGAVVSTAEELRDAVNSGKETICVYGKIDLGDISTSGGLSLQENQKLVGVEYFGNFKDGEGFSGISATASVAKDMIEIKKTGCLISDLSINYDNTASNFVFATIRNTGNNVSTNLQNLDITTHWNENNQSVCGVIIADSGSSVNLSQKINIQTNVHAAIRGSLSTININSDSVLNLSTDSSNWSCVSCLSTTLNIRSGAYVNIASKKDGIALNTHSTLPEINIEQGAFVNILCPNGSGILLDGQVNANISGNLNIESKKGIYIRQFQNKVNITSTAVIYFNTETENILNSKSDGTNHNILEIASGAKIAFEKKGSPKWYEVKENYRDENTSTATDNKITADNVETILKVENTSPWKTASEIIEEKENEEENYTLFPNDELVAYQKQFNNALSQYDMLINDSAYKGINLLKEDTLKVNFNEDKSAHLLIQGVDMTSEGIGLLSADWNTDKDVQTSLEQVLSAQKKLRSAATKLGNCYSIVSERQNFTENLINVLTEGADKLTLADMNEESANMLALQTQQQLAINSLSLASQASQGVLRLF